MIRLRSLWLPLFMVLATLAVAASAGWPGVQAFWQGAMDMGVKAAKLETVEVTLLGDAAYEVGRYAMEAAGGQLLDRGKYVVIWQRHGDAWKLHRDIWNTSQTA